MSDITKALVLWAYILILGLIVALVVESNSNTKMREQVRKLQESKESGRLP